MTQPRGDDRLLPEAPASCLADQVWPDLAPADPVVAEGDRRHADAGPLVLVPVGSIEQHGPHLPVDTDTVIAVAVAERVAARIEQELNSPVLVAPAVTYGSSGEHQAFPGTVSIGTETLRLVIIELVRSLRTWAGRVVFVNAHGGNLTALRNAVDQLRVEGHEVSWVACANEDVDLHAGLTETSLLLHLCPERVRLDRAEPGNTEPLQAILPRLIAEGVRGVSPNGVLGDPTGASAAEGARVLATMVDSVVDSVAGAVRESVTR